VFEAGTRSASRSPRKKTVLFRCAATDWASPEQQRRSYKLLARYVMFYGNSVS